MKLSVGIIESEAYHARYLEDQLKIWNKSACQDLQIHHIGPEDILFLPPFRDMDVLFLDVHFNQNSGLELAKKLRESGFSHAIILLSTHDKYALYGYDIHAFHYLIKPEMCIRDSFPSFPAISLNSRLFCRTSGRKTLKSQPAEPTFSRLWLHLLLDHI